MSSPGLHDPYWYEDTLAELFAVEMLDPSSGIESVTLQQPGLIGIDDIVVRYRDGKVACYQVKHTRSEDNLTFADLLKSKENRPSLLRQFVAGWQQQTAAGVACETHLYTNRAAGERATTIDLNGRSLRLPPLFDFWTTLQPRIAAGTSVDILDVPTELRDAWEFVLAEVSSSTGDPLGFLRTFHLDVGQPALEALEQKVVGRLQEVFSIPSDVARDALSSLDSRLLRKWSTSNRPNDPRITREAVLGALKLPYVETVGEHDLPPPTPAFPSRLSFIEDLAAELRRGAHRVIFLRAEAGSGKTSVVSSIADRGDSPIDLRFHAFRPITPDRSVIPQDVGRTATATALWGDLLVQLRERFFVNRLAEANVPVRNDFLQNDPDRMRAEVLRLSVLLAQERSMPTVIAIDGIDHAARALAMSGSPRDPLLLGSLVPPDHVPSEIVFLIAGQPNPAYPSWLQAERDDVHLLTLPPIAIADIVVELSAKSGMMDRDQIDAAARVIESQAKGNTLASVYGAHEARQVPDAAALEKRLKARRLDSGLDAYYGSIWDTALKEYRGASPALDTSLATALSISSARLTGSLLRSFFPDLRLSARDWNVVCRSLAPVIDEVNGTFAVFHNDVRVALSAHLASDPHGFREAASSMADHLLAAKPTTETYLDLFRLLDFAERAAEKPRVFTASFVAYASGLGRPVGEIMEFARESVGAVSPATGWDSIHELGLGLATLQQWRMTLDIRKPPSRTTRLPNVLPSEPRVLPTASWTINALRQLMLDVKAVLEAGEADRAAALLRRWLGSATPGDVLKQFDVALDHEGSVSDDDYSYRIEAILRAWGAAAQQTGLSDRIRDTVPKSEVERFALALFHGGWVEAGLKNPSRPWRETLAASRPLSLIDLEVTLEQLASAERWEDVGATLDAFENRYGDLPLTLRVRGAEWALRAGGEDRTDPWVLRMLQDGFASLIEYEDKSYREPEFLPTLDGRAIRRHADPLMLFISAAYTMGWMHPSRPALGIGEEVNEAWLRRRSRERESVSGHFILAARLGRLSSSWGKRGPVALDDFSERELRELLGALLRPRFGLAANVGAVTGASNRFLREITTLFCQSERHAAVITEVFREYVRNGGYGYSYALVWNVLQKRGDLDTLRWWLLSWIGPEGKVWDGELGERVDTVEAFGTLGREAGLNEEVDVAEERLRWNFVAYSGHKEIALETPLRWFKAVRSLDPTVWENEGLRLMSISKEASRAGDNLLSIDVPAAIGTAAASVSVSAFARFIDGVSKDSPRLANVAAWEGIIGALEHANIDEDDLVALWCGAAGSLVWRAERDKLQLADVREAILVCAQRQGFKDLPDRLRILAPFEFGLPRPDRGGYGLPERWFAPWTKTRDPKHYELSIRLTSLPLGAAIDELRVAARASACDDLALKGFDIWHAAAICARRLVEECSSDLDNHLAELKQIAMMRRSRWVWSHGEFDDFLELLAPHMTEVERWDLVLRMLRDLDYQSDRVTWLHAATENLRFMSFVVARTSGAQSVRAGLNRELAAQELWIRGPEDQNRSEWPLYHWPAEPFATGWDTLIFEGLLELLDSSEAHPTQTAMRGLYRLIATFPKWNDAFIARLSSLSDGALRFALPILEPLAARFSERVQSWRPGLEQICQSGPARARIQSAIVLRTADRARRGEPQAVDFGSPISHQHSLVVPRSRPVLRDAARKYGSLTLASEWSAAEELILRIAAITGIPEDELYPDVTPLLNELPVPEERERVKTRLMNDSTLTPSFYAERVVAWIFEEWRAGCFGDLSVEAIGQATLEHDDPYVIVGSHRAMSGDWPVDDALRKLIAHGASAVQEALRPICSRDLAEDEMLLGAVLYTYDWKSDVTLRVEHRWSTDLAADDPSCTFNGRAFVFFAPDRFEPRESRRNGWVTARSGGGGYLSRSLIDPFPSELWRRLKWSANPSDPLRWSRTDGTEVARFEVLLGPMRSSAPDALYRHPLLFRWVGKKDTLAQIERVLGRATREHADLDIDPFRSD